jgi:hypothetical protein
VILPNSSDRPKKGIICKVCDRKFLMKAFLQEGQIAEIGREDETIRLLHDTLNLKTSQRREFLKQI